MAFNPEAEFVVDEVEQVIKTALQTTLGDSQYNPAKANQWTSQIIEHSLKALSGMKKPFKYIVTVILQQKVGAGLHTACAAHWDTKADGLCKLTLDNGYIECICTVYGLAIAPSATD